MDAEGRFWGVWTLHGPQDSTAETARCVLSRAVVSDFDCCLLETTTFRFHIRNRSYESYWFDGHLWASPIDAAAPVSSWRPDLMERSGIALPKTFEEVLKLARRGLVAVPATPVDSLMHFMICCALVR